MKYLKKYETITAEIGEGMYWLLPTDERLAPSLKEIGCPQTKIETFLRNGNIRSEKICFFIFQGRDLTANFNWGWNIYKGSLSDKTSELQGFKFSGTVNLNDDEKLELDANKYNL